MSRISSVPQFFAIESGDQTCFYCGAPCGTDRPASSFVRSTFFDVGETAAPNSEYVCSGCEVCLQEKAEINGRQNQKRRNYSWVLTASEQRALTKADVLKLQAACLAPPEPPYAIVIATSGQKHLLFRSRVNYDRQAVTVQLELERVTYAVSDLRRRLDRVAEILPHIGKSRMLDSHWPLGLSMSAAAKLGEGAEAKLEAWRRVAGEPLSRLAVFLTPSKDREND